MTGPDRQRRVIRYAETILKAEAAKVRYERAKTRLDAHVDQLKAEHPDWFSR